MNRYSTACNPHRTASHSGRKMISVLSRMAALVGLIAAFASTADAQGKVQKQADFNGDGFADLAIGAPGEGYLFNTLRGTMQINGAGVVHIMHGSPSGLVAQNILLTRKGEWNSSIFAPNTGASFGNALAWGDFNRDGYDDLAVAAPGDRNHTGSVTIFTGSINGLRIARHLRLNDMRNPHPAQTTGATRFGSALAVGDTNGDGYADLAISQNWGVGNVGAVYIVPGSVTGLRPTNSQTLAGVGWFNSLAPFSMTFGDFNGDRYFDLAMGLPYQTMSGLYGAGAVMVAFGTPYGIDSNPQIWSQNSPNIPGICEQYDQFGYSLTAADFNDDGKWDLAIGAPGENTNTGAVHVLFGQSNGLNSWATQIWGQDNPNVYEVAEVGDRFGESLAAGNFQSSLSSYRFPELLVGIPGENAGAGAIQLLSIAAYSTVFQYWQQGSGLILGTAEAGDRFGSSLAVGDFNRNGYPDVAVGVPGENTRAGAINILFGANYGISNVGNRLFMQGLSGMLDTPENYDYFGRL